jgi:hypothetical protein
VSAPLFTGIEELGLIPARSQGYPGIPAPMSTDLVTVYLPEPPRYRRNGARPDLRPGVLVAPSVGDQLAAVMAPVIALALGGS